MEPVLDLVDDDGCDGRRHDCLSRLLLVGRFMIGRIVIIIKRQWPVPPYWGLEGSRCVKHANTHGVYGNKGMR
jgi:hypothetical protein